MIDERHDTACDIFLCYREASAETAKNIKTYMKKHPKKHFGRVWYSDDENIGNFKFDIKKHIASAHSVFFFLTHDFTIGFLTEDGKVNKEENIADNLNSIYGECITVQELIEIEKQRQIRDIKIICVNVNNYYFTPTDLEILRNVFLEENILRDDTIAFYKDLNRNNYLRRQTSIDSFAERILKGLEKKIIVEEVKVVKKEKRGFFSKKKNENINFKVIQEVDYKKMFNEHFISGKYRTVKIFGYTGEVVSNDLLTYADRYIDYVELRLLHRNPFIEEVCQNEHNNRTKDMGLRLWDKYNAILKMALEKWTFKLKREIRYYSHQPIIKGSIFCNDVGEPVVAFINAISWIYTPEDGGSQFKSVPSDMIYLSVENNNYCLDIIKRFDQQFDYEWFNGKTQEEIADIANNGENK